MLITKLIEALQNKKITPKNLTPHQRKVIIKFFLEEQSDISNIQIAELIGVTDVQVSRIKRQLLRQSTWEIEDLDVKTLAISLKKKKDELQRRATAKKDYALVWKIETEFIEKMQSLGFIHKEPDSVSVKHFMTLEDFRESKERYDKEKEREEELGFSIN